MSYYTVAPAQLYVVHHEDLHKPAGSRDFMTSSFESKFWFKKFVEQLELLKLDYFTEFDPEVTEEDGLAYEAYEPLEEDESQSWDELLEEIEYASYCL